MSCNQVVGKAQLDDFLTDALLRCPFRKTCRQSLDLLPGVQTINTGVRPPTFKFEVNCPGGLSSPAGYFHVPSQFRQSGRNHNGLSCIQVRNPLRKMLNRPGLPVDLNLIENRCLQFGEQLSHLLLYFAGFPDIGEGSSTQLGSLTHEVAVWRRTYPDRKQPALTEMFPNKLEHCTFITNAAVRQEYYLPDSPGIFSVTKRHAYGRENLRATLRRQFFYLSNGVLDVLEGRGLSSLEKRLAGGVESNNVEVIVGRQAGECERQRGLGLLERRTIHAPRRVYNVDHFPRKWLGFLTGRIGRHDHDQCVGLTIEDIAEQSGVRSCTDLGPPLKYEIPVRRNSIVL